MLGFIYHTSEYGWLVLLIVGLLFLGKYALNIAIYALASIYCILILLINAIIYAVKGKWSYFKEHWRDQDSDFGIKIHL